LGKCREMLQEDCSDGSGNFAHGIQRTMAAAVVGIFVQARWGIEVVLDRAIAVVADVVRTLLHEDLGTDFVIEHVMVQRKVTEMVVDSWEVAADADNLQRESFLQPVAASELPQKMQPLQRHQE
jgi:hypothetical protein